MIDRQTAHRSLAVSGSVLVAFIGLVHEVVGASLYPWGPAEFGGPIAWHLLGLAAIATGVLLLAGALQVLPTPVVGLSAVAAALGGGITMYAAVVHGQLHLFALAFCLSALVVATCHRRAEGATAREI